MTGNTAIEAKQNEFLFDLDLVKCTTKIQKYNYCYDSQSRTDAYLCLFFIAHMLTFVEIIKADRMLPIQNTMFAYYDRDAAY